MIQLLLAPAKGWEDISEAGDDPARLCRDGLYPILGIFALSNFVGLFFYTGPTLIKTIEHAVIDFGSYFACYFIGVLLLEQFLPNIVSGEINRRKIETVAIYSLGLLALIGILSNCLPTELTLVTLLPLFVALIVYKADRYLAVKPHDDIRYLIMSVVSLIVLPILLRYLLMLLI